VESGMDEKPEEAPAELTAHCDSRERTLRLGEVIGGLLKAGDLVLLMGELGAGKTTLAQGLCRGAGMDEGVWARSPTFTLINEYTARIPIRHADLYRVDSWEDFSTIGLFDPSFQGITLVEWGDKLPAGLKVEPTMILRLSQISEMERSIMIEGSPRLLGEIASLITI